jgi:hypothetical protein
MLRLNLFRFGADVNAFDFYSRQFSAVTNGAVITLAPPKFESDDFFVFALLNHLCGDLCARDQRVTVRQIFAVGIHQHIAERRRFARIDIQKIDIDRVAFRDSILPAASLDNCVSHKRFQGEKAAQIHTEARL